MYGLTNFAESCMGKALHQHWPAIVVITAVIAGALRPGPCRAQTPAPQADPQDFGLEVPTEGPLRLGDGRRLLVPGGATGSDNVAALLYFEMQDMRIVMMPDGRLTSFAADKTQPTSQPFVALKKEELAHRFAEKRFKGFKARTTARYVYVYNTSEGFQKATSRILETMFPAVAAYFKRQKLASTEPLVPLVVIMFRTEDEFQKYHRMPDGVVAYYSPVSNHVVMYEQSKLVEVAPELALKQSIGTIAHEGIHQILHNIGVQKRLSYWPIWIAEGLPEYFAPTSTDRRMRWKGVGTVNDMRMYELEEFLKRGTTTRGELVEKVVDAQQLSSTGYAVAWGLTHYLAATQREKFKAYLAAVSKIGPLETADGLSVRSNEKAREVFTKHFGNDWGKLEDGMLGHLQGLPYANPIENQTHYVVMLDTVGMRTAGVTASPAAIKKWQEQTLATVPPAVRARASFQVRPFPSRTTAETFASQWLHAR